VEGGKRAATVKAVETSEFFIVNGGTYRQILAQQHRKDISNRVWRSPQIPAHCLSFHHQCVLPIDGTALLKLSPPGL
jgi:hypothetical protein